MNTSENLASTGNNPEREAIEKEMEWDTHLGVFGGTDKVRSWINRLALATKRGEGPSVKDPIAQVLATALYKVAILEEQLEKPPFNWDATPRDVVQKLDILLAPFRRK